MTPKSSSVWGFSRAFVYSRERAYVLAHVPALEEQRIHLTQVFRWTDEWASFRVDWPCVAICGTEFPEPSILCFAPDGRVKVATKSGFSDEHLDRSANGPAARGAIRDARLIAGQIYAVGMGRQVYRRTPGGNWIRHDQGVLAPLDDEAITGFNSIDGFPDSRLYAVGWGGQIWHFDGRSWSQFDTPTNLKLQRVVCAPPNAVYACGQAGVLLNMKSGLWEVIEHEETREQFWGMEWFAGALWLSTTDTIYRLNGERLEKMDLGFDGTLTTGWLHSRDGVMWSVGGEHLLSTEDGKKWVLHQIPA